MSEIPVQTPKQVEIQCPVCGGKKFEVIQLMSRGGVTKWFRRRILGFTMTHKLQGQRCLKCQHVIFFAPET